MLAEIYWSVRGPWEMGTGKHKCGDCESALAAPIRAICKERGDTDKHCADLGRKGADGPTKHEKWNRSEEEEH